MYGIKNKGIGGLTSGLDTDSLVEALTAGTRSKINAQSQKKSLLNWKVSAYRTMASALRAYQDKYLKSSVTSKTNLTSNEFFKTNKATSSSDKISVTASTASLLGDFSIDRVAQLATSATLTNKTQLSTDLTFGIKVGSSVSSDAAFTGKTLQLDLDGSGTPKNIKLDSLNQFIVNAGEVDSGNGTYTYSAVGAMGSGDWLASDIGDGTFSGSFTNVGDGNGAYEDMGDGKYKFVGENNGNCNFDGGDGESPTYNNDGTLEYRRVGEGLGNCTATYNNDGTPRTIYKLDETKKTEIEAELNRLMTEAFGTKNNYNADGTVKDTVSKVTASIAADGTIKLDSDASKISVYSDCTAVGLARGKSNRVDMSTKIGAISAFADVQGDVLSFSINGVEITVTKNDTLSTLKSRIDSSTAGVRFDYNQYTDEFIFTAKSTGAGNTINVKDTQGNLMNQLFGAESGGGIGTNWLISKDTPTGQNVIKGDGGYTQDEINKIIKNISNLEFNLTIDGVTKLVKADASALNDTRLSEGTSTIQDIINAINKGITNSFSGTNVEFSTNSEGKIRMTGGYSDLSVGFAASASIGGSYNALAALGVTENAIGNTVLDMGYNNTITAADSPSLPIGMLGGDISGTFNLTINGVTKQIEVFKNDAASLNAGIKAAFGSNTASNVYFSMDNGKLTLNTKDSNTSISIGHGETIGNKVDIYGNLGFGSTAVNNVNPGGGITFGDLKNSYDPATVPANDHSNSILSSGTLTFTLADGSPPVTVSYNTNTKLQDFLSAINTALGDPTAASINNGRLSIKSEYMTGVSDNGNMLEKFFGIKGGSFESSEVSYGTDKFVAGKDAEVVVSGKTLSYSSNTFTMNGTTVTVNAVSEATDRPITVSVKSDPEDVVERLKSWIEDYNGLIATLNSAIYEGKAKDYAPLTDEQKAEMTDDQIKTWETEAKKGLLRNDQTLSKIIADLRNDMYKKVEAAGISLFDVGITTKTYSYTDITQSGQLEITDENKLRDMLTKDPDKVRLLFTDPSDGLAARMNTIINAAANTSSISRGSLYRLAGTESLTGDNSSVLGKQIDDIDKYVTTLKTRLQSEYTRYWKQFTALETAIQKMNAQSSWLTQS